LYLLDTNVVSELRKPRPHGAVLAWFESIPESALYIAAVTFGELQVGVERTRTRDPPKAEQIDQWIDLLAGTYTILPMDAATFREWTRLMHGQSAELTEDAMIAATAAVHGLIVATRNIRDFERLGAATFNPFA
jgi:predicted nucleic acid-binding protein